MTDYLLNFARFYATIKHGNQLYAGNLPYSKHLDDVEKQVQKWFDHYYLLENRPGPFDHFNLLHSHLDDFLAIARLHDVLEDCPTVKKKELVELFGNFVAEIVWCVTNEPGPNRKIRHALTYPKIRNNPAAVFIKLCDRISHVEHGGSMVGMYAEEQEDFERNLRTSGQFDAMWEHLKALLRDYEEYLP